jgi:hypothetical protein
MKKLFSQTMTAGPCPIGTVTGPTYKYITLESDKKLERITERRGWEKAT